MRHEHGQVWRYRNRPVPESERNRQRGHCGTEVTIGRNGGLEMADADIKLRLKPFKISEIKRDMSGLNLVACVLDAGDIREFVRKDGSKGRSGRSAGR